MPDAVTMAEDRITGGLLDLVDNLLGLALGEVAGEADDGSPVYSRPPDCRACIYLIDRVMGKPTERAETFADVDVRTLDDAMLRALVESYGVEGGASAKM